MKKPKRLWIGAAVFIAAGIGFALLSPWPRARGSTRMHPCQENLTKIDGAKEQLVLHSNWLGPIRVEDIVRTEDGTGFLKHFPICPSGGSYIIHPIGTNPVCTSGLVGHSLTEVGIAITAVE